MENQREAMENLNDLKLQKNNEKKVAQENLDAAKELAAELSAGKVELAIVSRKRGRTFIQQKKSRKGSKIRCS